MPGPSDSLSKYFAAAAGRNPAAAADDDLPLAEEAQELTIAQMDGRYASLRPANGNLTRLHVVTRTGRVRTMQYADLTSDANFDGDHFTLTFAGVKPLRVTVKGYGPRFWALYDYCCLHRCPYLREAACSVPGAGPDDTVLERITIADVPPAGTE